MNIALGAFIITLLFLPAVSFRIAINRLENLKGLLLTLSITDSIWVFTIVPIIIHLVLLLILRSLNYVIKLDLLLHITFANAKFPLHNDSLVQDLINFLAYNLLAIKIGFFSGLLINMIERRWNLISHLLGHGNEWYRAFEANMPEIPSQAGTRAIDLVYLDVLIITKESSMLYSGALANYHFRPRTKDLDYLVLRFAQRRDLRKIYCTEDPCLASGKASFYDPDTGRSVLVKGDYLIIPMKEVLNINITYFYYGIAPSQTGQQAA